MPSDQTSKDLALGIVDFLKSAIADGTITSDDAESVEVAIECLSDVFQVDESRKEQVYGKQNLLSIFNAFQRLKERKKSSEPAETTEAAPSGPSEADKAKAEELKAQGNKAMGLKDYGSAIDFYTQAINLDPTNAIYLSNRAAAHSFSGAHEEAADDARAAIKIDSNYTKAYSRLGLALYSLGDAEGAVNAYSNGLKLEGATPSEAMKRGFETAKKKVAEDLDSVVPVTTDEEEISSRSAPSDSGAGAGAGAGGFDLNSLMNNPAIAQMAQKFMSNPGALSDMLNNPALKGMMDNVKNSGSMPDMNDLMNNPMLQNMAKNFMGNKK
ncbi:uncharacterized protein SAPINGB_P005953 [Magnusiomyces paraingens]|uniref:SGTA homodimerisation domain-containing protein n=1 Tax=Magnusiomyces paraingens TaxID=2606893 RepID=A0A5E8C3K6_9ASCO|nr:uncharacterized protein SAPINGB_P005953 [Saprochaete ingens]VVT57932.1 unnamed protein product [Saprochaete ingens]